MAVWAALAGFGRQLAASAGGAAGGGALARVASTGVVLGGLDLAQIMLAPTTRSFHYDANRLASNVKVGPQELIRLWWSGRISRLDLETMLGYNGVWWTGNFADATTPNEKAWWNSVELSRPQPNFELLRYWWLISGQPDGGEGFSKSRLKDMLLRDGLFADRDQDAYINRPEILHIGQVVSLWLQGALTRQQADAYLQQLGYLRQSDRDAIFSLTEVPDLQTVLWLWNRGQLADADARKIGMALGYTDDSAWETAVLQRQSLPQARESLALGLPHIQDDGIAGRYGLDREFAPELEDWLRGAGRWWGPPVNLPDAPGQTIPRQAAELWRSHWQMPSPAAAATMYQRLRPDAMFRLRTIPNNTGGLLFPNLQEFTPDDFYKCMQAAGIPPSLRDQLTAVSFTPLSQRILQRSVFFGLADSNRVTSSFLDLGYAPPDAQLASDTITAAARWQQDGPARSIQQAAVRKLIQLAMDQYGTGQIDRATATARIAGFGISAGAIDDLLGVAATTRPVELNAKLNESAVSGGIKEVMRLYEMGAISDAEASSYLTPWGLSQPTVQAMLLQTNLRTRSDVARSGISSLRSDYRAGLLSDSAAVGRLQGFGITPQRAANYVAQWRAGMSDIRRRLNTQQIIKFVQDGLITFDAAASRLSNLGWAQPDILIWLAAARQQIDSANARALKAAQLTAKKAAAEAARIHKENIASQDRLLNKLKSELRPSDLKKWFKDGIISVEEYAAQLNVYGYPDAVIARIIGDVFKPPEVLNPVPSGGQPIQKPPREGG